MKKYNVPAGLLASAAQIAERHAKIRAAAPDTKNESGWYRFARSDAKKDEVDLFIYSEISSYYGVTANDFVRDLNEITAKTINLHINSPGGSVFEGFVIFSALSKHAAKIIVHIDGWAASIASVIAMAGDVIKVSAVAEIMIHEPYSMAWGSADDMRREADVLDSLEESIIDIYTSRTGGDRDEITQWVKDETWFKGQAAVDAGFADECVPLKKKEDDTEDNAARPAASLPVDYFASIFPHLPNDVRAALAESNQQNDAPQTERQFKNFLRKHGFSGQRADAIAANGFKPKSDPRDGAPPVVPTTTDPRDGAEKRDALAAIRAASFAASVVNMTHSPN